MAIDDKQLKVLLEDEVIKANSSTEAIKTLFAICKEHRPKYSLGFICKKLDMSSKGYMSDIVNGRRIANERYWEGLSSLFLLDGPYAELFKLFLSCDKEENEKKKTKVQKEIDSLRRSLKDSREVIPEKLKSLFFAFEVFCAFGLFKNVPTKKDLKKYFGAARGIELDYALHALESLDLIKKEDGDKYSLLQEFIRFQDSEDGVSHIDFLKHAAEDARANVSKWFDSDEAVFESNILSVHSSEYNKMLSDIQGKVRQMQADLESGDADQIVRFNLQVYPVKPK